jgi:NAD-dependent SIR2 family protein deacetylase
VVVVNLEETGIDREAAVAVHGKAGETLPSIVEGALDGVEVPRADD